MVIDYTPVNPDSLSNSMDSVEHEEMLLEYQDFLKNEKYNKSYQQWICDFYEENNHKRRSIRYRSRRRFSP